MRALDNPGSWTRAGRWGVAWTAASVLWLGACAPIPVPGSVSGAIPAATQSAIQPGSSTRADVLLQLAEPAERGEGDRYFLYSSNRTHGTLLFVALLYYPVPLGEISGHSCFHLAIVFDAGGTVSKIRAFQGQTQPQSSTIFSWNSGMPSVCRTDAELRQAVAAWFAEP